MSEIYEIEDVKTEFLQKVGVEYSQAFAPRQIELALYVLNDFCNSLTSNGLVLLRQTQPQQPMMPQQQYQAPPQYQQMPFQQQQPIQQQQRPQLMQGDPFQEDELMQQRIQQNVIEMNNSLKRPRSNRGLLNDDVPQIPPVPQSQSRNDDVNLASQKPKSFVDGLKAMRSGKKPLPPSDDDDE